MAYFPVTPSLIPPNRYPMVGQPYVVPQSPQTPAFSNAKTGGGSDTQSLLALLMALISSLLGGKNSQQSAPSFGANNSCGCSGVGSNSGGFAPASPPDFYGDALSLNSMNNIGSTSPLPASAGSDVTQFGSVDPNQLNQHLRGVLAGKGDAFVKAGEKYGVDPKLLVAIAQLESGHGSSSAARTKNNTFGTMDSKTGWMTIKHFDSVEENIEYAAINLRRNYIDKGLDTIEEIHLKYCPPGAANDPKGLNGGWAREVSKLYNNLNA